VREATKETYEYSFRKLKKEKTIKTILFNSLQQGFFLYLAPFFWIFVKLLEKVLVSSQRGAIGDVLMAFRRQNALSHPTTQ
jgi:hypothetical protein